MNAVTNPSGMLGRALLACLATLVGGCASGPEASLRSLDRVSTFGANPQFDNERYEMVDLITLLDPNNKRAEYSISDKRVDLFTLTVDEATKGAADAQVRQQLALAEIAFYHVSYGDPVVRRNRIQDRLIGASNQRCSAYKTYLNRFDAYQQSGFGSATTLLGGAAGIVSGVKDARILGGLAGITSGVQAEIAQGFLGNLASYVIVPGMELRRKTILEAIYNRRANGGEYTLQAALADAARYHGGCTLVVGLEQAKEAIQTVENPGMRMMAVTLNNVLQTRAMQKTIAKQEAGAVTPEDLVIPAFRLNDQPIAAATGQQGVRITAPPAGSAGESPEDLAHRASDLSTAAVADAQNAGELLGKQLQDLQSEIDAPTKPALTDKIKAVRAALVPRIDKLKAAKAVMAGAAIANAGRAADVMACLVKLDQRVRIAELADQPVAATDRDLGVALVTSSMTQWLAVKATAVDAWNQQLRAAIDVASFKALQTKTASDIDADKVGRGVDSAIDAGKTVLDGFPTIDFKARGIATCS